MQTTSSYLVRQPNGVPGMAVAVHKQLLGAISYVRAGQYNIVTDSNVLCKETFIWNHVPCDKRGKLLPIGGAAYTCNYTTSP